MIGPSFLLLAKKAFAVTFKLLAGSFIALIAAIVTVFALSLNAFLWMAQSCLHCTPFWAQLVSILVALIVLIIVFWKPMQKFAGYPRAYDQTR